MLRRMLSSGRFHAYAASYRFETWPVGGRGHRRRRPVPSPAPQPVGRNRDKTHSQGAAGARTAAKRHPPHRPAVKGSRCVPNRDTPSNNPRSGVRGEGHSSRRVAAVAVRVLVEVLLSVVGAEVVGAWLQEVHRDPTRSCVLDLATGAFPDVVAHVDDEDLV
jgi:hypothetical protein